MFSIEVKLNLIKKTFSYGATHRNYFALDWGLFLSKFLRTVQFGKEVGVGNLLDHIRLCGLDHNADHWGIDYHP
jgi:hypothetical protein